MVLPISLSLLTLGGLAERNPFAVLVLLGELANHVRRNVDVSLGRYPLLCAILCALDGPAVLLRWPSVHRSADAAPFAVDDAHADHCLVAAHHSATGLAPADLYYPARGAQDLDHVAASRVVYRNDADFQLTEQLRLSLRDDGIPPRTAALQADTLVGRRWVAA